MRRELLQDLRHPKTGETMEFVLIDGEENDEVLEAELQAPSSKGIIVRAGIPRFVNDPPYARSFGEQWNRYRTAQLDSKTGLHLSADRFFEGTGWSPESLKG